VADGTCSIQECDRRLLARGRCQFHYDLWRRTDPVIRERQRAYAREYVRRPEARARARAWHRLHYQPKTRKTAAERFWSKVDKHGPRAGRLGFCWVWTGAKHRGYGLFTGKPAAWIGAHRWPWIEENGPVPAGHLLHHLCALLGGAGPPCVRPSHLELTTRAEHRRLHRKKLSDLGPDQRRRRLLANN